MTEPAFPFEFPERPAESASTQETLRYAIGVLEIAIRLTEPRSPRMKALSSLIRFLEGGVNVLNNVESGGTPLRNLATALEWRDRARAEQQWIDEWLRDEELEGELLDAVLYYKVQLARLESAATVSIGYVGTKREGKRNTGGWWARQVGRALMDMTKVGSALMVLPENNDVYRKYVHEFLAKSTDSSADDT